MLPALTLAIACHRGSDDSISGTGTLEVVEVDVAPTVPARITRVWVEEGASVRAGDTLVSLTQPTAHPDVEARRARLSAAEAQLRDLEAGARPAELQRAEAELRAAEAEATRTAKDLLRMAPLAQNGTISAQQFDAVRSAASAAAARRDAAREALRLLREGTRPERIRAARAEVENARAALAAAEGTASDLVLTAPVSGAILARHAEPGEILAAGEAALTIGEVARPWVRIYVGQNALPLIHVGDSASARLDDFPKQRFAGRVVSINDKAEFTPRVALTEEERADLLFGVKIELRDTSGMLKAGLPVTVQLASAARGRRRVVEPSDSPAAVPISSRQ
jgi:HlyD family secretion protein